MENPEHKYTNSLINESSPYLLQHAHNPVDWHPWNEETLEKAKAENKMIIVSIGYSACHWCHVMEHESFEDEEVAKIMNENFICIKVDREERPDVDQVYMDAVQMIGGRGGWPLNCFALPDGRPFWGATYFPKDQWKKILENMVLLYETQHSKLEQQAKDITEGISSNHFLNDKLVEPSPFQKEDADGMAAVLAGKVDRKYGGSNGAPKFPMPNNYLFLLEHYFHSKDENILKKIELTLDKMGAGGIYDQIGGGFARYSVDEKWHVPHFEKMLYDNAQLVSLYAKAYMLTGKEEYRRIVEESLTFVQNELQCPEGGFYSALDADSEGEEGKFYVWQSHEIDVLFPKNKEIIVEYFGIDKEAYWEEGNNVLIKNSDIADLAEKFGMDKKNVNAIITDAKQTMMDHRAKRIRPGLDDKILTSWNALMIKAYVDAYYVSSNKNYLDIAISSGDFLLKHTRTDDGGLYHTHKNGTSSITGFLEDYAALIEALISLYQATFNEKWILEAKSLADYSIEHFYSEESGMFYFTSDLSSDLIARKMEVTDNVIPSSNSTMANALFDLGLLLEIKQYREIAESMIQNVVDNLKKYPQAFSNWGRLYLKYAYPYSTFVITGPEAMETASALHKIYHPDIMIAVAPDESDLPIFKNRFKGKETLIYVCIGTECLLPVTSIDKAMSGFHSHNN